MDYKITEPASLVTADDLVPNSFQLAGKRIVPMNLHEMSLNIVADVPRGRAAGHAFMRISTEQRGRPWLDLVPNPTALRLNGVSLAPSKLPLVAPPGGAEKLRMLDVELDAGSRHDLEIEYQLSDKTVSFVDGGIRIGFFMTDLGARSYLEQHAPASLEYDPFPMTVNIKIVEARGSHHLFTNGQGAQLDAQNWRVVFPDYFTCSSFFLHFTNHNFRVINRDFRGIERVIPIIVYGADARMVEAAMEGAMRLLREFEGLYGAYAHERLVIYITEELGFAQGMEYCGAAMTSGLALRHEILHSWFGRGVMPASGNAGWIDEAIAYWDKMNYRPTTPNPNRPAVNLAGFSAYRRYTTREAYGEGSLFLSELDSKFRPRGGLKPLLTKLYAEQRRAVISTHIFKTFLERETNTDLSDLFERFVYGQDIEIRDLDALHIQLAESGISLEERLKKAWDVADLAPPTYRYTTEELKQLL